MFLRDSPKYKAKSSRGLFFCVWIYVFNVHTEVLHFSYIPHVWPQTLESAWEGAAASLPFPKCWNIVLWLSAASHTVHDQGASQKVLWETNIHTNIPSKTFMLCSEKDVVVARPLNSSHHAETVHVCPGSHCAGQLWWCLSLAKQWVDLESLET